MEISANISLTFGCLLASALKKMYASCKIVKIDLSEKNSAMVYFTCDELINTTSFKQIELQAKKIVNKISIKPNGACSMDDLQKMMEDNQFKFSSKFFEAEDSWQKVTVNEDEFIIRNEKMAPISDVKSFSIESIGGANFNDNSVIALNVISGVAFKSEADKKAYDEYCEDIKQRDHRRLGQQLEIFTFNDLVGKGMPLWLPNGGTLRYLISNCINHLRRKYNFQFVATPVLGNLDLFKKSGHWAHYREFMFAPIETDNEKLVLRPMTCPHHCLIYDAFKRSEKDLPLRLSEDSILHRYEASGGLMGLERVRVMTLPDTHIFCAPEQVTSEITNCYKMVKEAMELFGFKFSRVDLSLHNPEDKEKYVDNPKLWAFCEEELRKTLKTLDIEFVEKIGEAAFYGPKIDFQVKNYSGKMITVSTIQFDFNLPNFFGLKYTKDGEEHVPVIIHFGLIGTLERFVATLLEQTKGVFPFWLAINQVRVIPINVEKHGAFCKQLVEVLKSKHLRVDIDNSDERLAKKIRTAQMMKIPYQVVIGDNEMNSNFKEISYREYGSEELKKTGLDEFLSMLVGKNNVFNW